MSIYQINLFVCEICGESHTTHEETWLYSDPTVMLTGWAYLDELLVCPKCIEEAKAQNE
jgi:hypothetical protein